MMVIEIDVGGGGNVWGGLLLHAASFVASASATGTGGPTLVVAPSAILVHPIAMQRPVQLGSHEEDWRL